MNFSTLGFNQHSFPFNPTDNSNNNNAGYTFSQGPVSTATAPTSCWTSQNSKQFQPQYPTPSQMAFVPVQATNQFQILGVRFSRGKNFISAVCTAIFFIVFVSVISTLGHGRNFRVRMNYYDYPQGQLTCYTGFADNSTVLCGFGEYCYIMRTNFENRDFKGCHGNPTRSLCFHVENSIGTSRNITDECWSARSYGNRGLCHCIR